MFTTNTTKITSSGQVTLPKEIRDILSTSIVFFEVDEDNKITVKPIYSVAGSLKSYKKSNLDFNEARNLAWDSVADEWKE